MKTFFEAIRCSRNINSNIDLLSKLLKIKFKEISKENIVRSNKFSELLKETINRFQQGIIDNNEALDEVINLSYRVAVYKMNGDTISRSKVYVAVRAIIHSKNKYF